MQDASERDESFRKYVVVPFEALGYGSANTTVRLGVRVARLETCCCLHVVQTHAMCNTR